SRSRCPMVPLGSWRRARPAPTWPPLSAPDWPRRPSPRPSTERRVTSPRRCTLRHSTPHVRAKAVTDLWPGARFAIGPPIEDGFYYDFELPGGAHFSDDDLGRIEATMREIMAEDQPFIRHEHTIDEGLLLFEDQPFKREIIQAVGAGQDEVDAAGDGSGSSGVST